MKRVAYLFLVLFFVSCGSDNTTTISSDSSKSGTSQQISSPRVSVQSVLSGMEKGKYREGELLVKFRSGVVAASSSKVHHVLGAVSLKRFTLVPNLDHVRLPEGLSVKDAIIKYMEDPSVEYAEPNYIKRISKVPNDPLFAQQWGPTKIDAPGAWDTNTGNNNVIVAVIDSGIDLKHPDLIANIGPGSNFISNTSVPQDDNGHGTHVSGIIGAVGNNGIGVTGVMWNVKLMPLKFLDAEGNGFTSDEIDAIGFAVAHGAKVMNTSFAGSEFSCSEYAAVSSANVLLIAAAGNETANNDTVPSYPASFSNPKDPNLIDPAVISKCGVSALPALPNVISVAATDQNDNLASFSNFGLNAVQVAAPGVNILSTIPLDLPPCTTNPFEPNYDYCSGTSQATPFVSGLAGLIYSQNPNLSYLQVRSIIFSTVDILPSLNTKILTSGRINAFRALTAPIVPRISISPLSNNFGTANVGSTSSPQTFTVSNPGTADLIIGQVTLTGVNAAEFSVGGDGCSGHTIAPLFNCTIQATFSPASAGAKNASMSIPSNDVASPTTAVSLVGIGAAQSSSSGGGGGGGCSIGGRQNAPSAVADSLVILTPLLLVTILRRRKKTKR
ncbi:MAG TPA: S8 family serine peptidase [Thermodesulfovibrionales bacterium]|nr:S8 family serine peptidase [Thermodesulfovibrionales bacterium]